MIAYKFRSSRQINFCLDILKEQRLYCTPWKNLNDPMEGLFAFSSHHSDQQTTKNTVELIIEEKRPYRVCSLATDFQSHLMWSHYANGFDGMAIEVELPDNCPDIKRVEYRGVFASISLDLNQSEDQIARDILFSKYNEWAYEKEIRILSLDQHYSLPLAPRRVILGHRMLPALREMIYLFCNSLGINVNVVGIGDEGIDADRYYPQANSSP